MAELDALLETERQGKLDRSGKGNSLFSEVEDRRERWRCAAVKELKGRVGELQGQMQAQLRQNLQDSDKLREMARKVNLAETSLKQARLAV